MPNLESGTLIAHRGACAYFPENTLEAFQGAHEMGATWVETDVMLTKDGVPIMFHDEHLERMTGQKQYIADSTFDELKDIDVGSWFAPQFTNVHIPTLEECLHLLLNLDMSINLEIKPTPKQDKPTAEKAMEVVLREKFPKEKMIVSSFSLTSMETAYDMAPDYYHAFIADELPSLEVALASGIPWYSVHLDKKLVSTQLVRDLKAHGYHVLAYTVNDPAKGQTLFNQGVTAIFTDDPHLFKSGI